MEFLKSERFFLITWAAFYSIMLLYGIDTMSLWDQDEAAYAGFASNMVESSQFAIPEFTWSEIHRKPPLLFWLTALLFLSVEETEWTVRLISFLSVLSLPALLFYGLKSLSGYSIARNTAIITGSTLLIAVYGKIAFTDGLLLMFTSLCLISLLRLSYRYKNRDVIIFWLAFSLGLLTKGPAIAVIVCIALFFMLFFRDGRYIINLLKPWLWLPLSLLPMAIWLYFTWMQDGGDFARTLFDWYVLQRIGLGSDSAVLDNWSGPPGYYLVVHLIAFLPWIWLIPSGFGFIRNLRTIHSILFVLIAGWLVGAWFIWELLPSKLPSYTLAVHPLLAFILASGYDKIETIRTTERVFSAFGLLLVFLGCLGLIMGLVSFAGPAIFIIAIIAAMVFWMPMFISTIAFNMNKHELAFRTCALGSVVFLFMLWARIVPAIEPARGVYKTMQEDISALQATNASDKIYYKLDNATKMPSFLLYARWNETGHLWADVNSGDSLTINSTPLLTYDGLLTIQDTTHRDIIKTWPGWIPDRNLPLKFYLLSPVKD